MAYTSWSVSFGEQPSAAKWNILGTNDASFNDGTGIFGLKKDLLITDSNPYKFYAYRSSGWTTGSSVYAKVAFNAELFDTNNNFDTTNNRYTAPVAGFYNFSTACAFDVAAGGTYVVSLYKNNAEIIRFAQSEADNVNTLSACAGGTGILQLAASDYVEVFVYGTGSSGFYGATLTWFQGFLVSRT